MDPEHRKIELQSPADLTYLTTLIRTAARQKLDLHLPPVSSSTSEPDDLRRAVEDLVDAFVSQVLSGMRQNISINGIDVVAPGTGGDVEMQDAGGGEVSVVEKEEYEPFDEKTRVKLSAAVARRDALVARISQHRRVTPALASERWMERWNKEGEEMRVLLEGMERGVGEVDGGEGMVVKGLERREEVVGCWERAVEGLQRLNKGLPETRARLERAGDVLGYLGGGEGGK